MQARLMGALDLQCFALSRSNILWRKWSRGLIWHTAFRKQLQQIWISLNSGAHVDMDNVKSFGSPRQ
jgi:hypothetical protein